MGIICKLLSNRTLFVIRPNSIITRHIMSTTPLKAAVCKESEELKTNPYYEKYAQKIATLQQTSPEEFLSRIEARKTEKDKPKSEGESCRQYSSLLKPKEQLKDKATAEDAQLNKIMKMELIEHKDAIEITKIWQEYHKTKDVIAATIPSKVYEDLSENGQKYPTFVFPIPRSQGYEFIMSQFFRNTVHFTPLLNYQVHKENAPECLTITHYTEFKNSKGIVLMRGEFDSNILSAQEAQCLANQLQLYYSQNIPEKKQLLETFTKKPYEFKHMDLIKQIETFN